MNLQKTFLLDNIDKGDLFMMNWIMTQNVVFLAFLAGLFTWGCTILGSAVVFFFTKVSRKLLDIMMGFAAGVMIAASFWSLLDPALAYAKADYGNLAWVPAAVGFLLGAFSLRLIDALVPHLHLGKDVSEAEGIQPKKKLSKTALLFLAITIHNFPEGLAVGVTFGALASGNMTSAALIGALGLAIGIGLQIFLKGLLCQFRFELMEVLVFVLSFLVQCQPLLNQLGLF